MPDIESISVSLKNPKPILEAIGQVILFDVRENFRKQQFNGKRWPERYPQFKGKTKINLVGVIADFNAGRTPPSRRFTGRPVLRDTGRLFKSFSREIRGSSVIVGSNVDYADTHQVGGEVSISVSDAARKGLAKLAVKNKNLGRVVGKFVNMKRKDFTNVYKFKVHKRPMIGFTKDLKREIIENIRATIEAKKRGNA